ncbi:hypothetical protein K490DRAFT_71645 [Saccharata proteae CBS 121410]|uniref:Zn(2)-C6 fungal-type domain-containing protein n=1 Tax=Saccharata proteae CBS 121410 TaxID=1314787 RepID=A0A9P4HYS4_9PEZI|nr:hypothetical protein K490DRAFT_71645 [Saccharata proteae CBS 121410]
MSQVPASTTSIPNDAAAQPAPQRKRRRRAPATGATEDCFTCRKRQTKCDRRRPYCTQCIDIGKDCSGYRTTLTWGVGVASRGKLRGMSLPVPKSPSSPPTSSTRASRANTISHGKSATSAPSPAPSVPFNHSRDSSHFGAVKSPSPIRSPNVHDYPSLDATSPIQIPAPMSTQQIAWTLPGFGEHVEGYSAASGRRSRPQLQTRPLHRLHTSLAGSYDEGALSATTGPLSSYSDSVISDYGTPSDFPGTPDDFGYADASMNSYENHYLHPRTPMSSTESLVFPDAPRSYPVICEDLSSSISSDQSLHEFPDMNSMQPASYSQSGFSDMFFPGGLLLQPWVQASPYGTPPIPRNTISSHRLSSRMQFLLDYYDKAICPILVAFDGPMNPYRMHVMHLAMDSESLQNAIAALSINNIRMRQGTEARLLTLSKGQRLSNTALLPEYVYSQLTAEEIREMHGEPTPEELQYKATSIQLLNQQLADPVRAREDSVLATLLVLCLFHVCDSGFSKFRTQLAGVQKLLSMRERSSQSNFIGWIDMFFTWFDVMTSTVNDRETQVRGDSLDMLDLSANLGALEHLAGCEGRLFKIIARLGRLNLLSQNRPVSAGPGTGTGSMVDITPRPSPALKRNASDYYSLGFDRLDGNGWGTPLGAEESAAVAAEEPLAPLSDDQRHEFWNEWRDVRARLQEWELDPATQPSMCSASGFAQTASQRDLLHISESFRYSALLYTERLAHPQLPSSSLNFQNLVAQALYHISQIGVKSCVNKFLLWPLFITGTECVDDSHRGIVRQRCIEIQRESGFFNNLSGLEVLERTWREDDEGLAMLDTSDTGRQAFRWRKAMDRVDGEYILI